MSKPLPILLIFLFFCFQISIAQPELLWEKNFGSSQDDYAKYLLPTSDGNLLMLGTKYVNTGLTRDLYIAKLSGTTGAIIWDKSYLVNQSLGDNYNLILAYETSDAYVIIGDYDIGTTQNDIFKINKTNGAFIGLYCDNMGKGATALAPSPQSDIYLVGSTSNSGLAQIQAIDITTCTVTTQITNPTEAENWGHTIERLIPTPDGGYLVLGKLDSSDIFCDVENTDIWAAKLDANYNLLWTERYGGQSLDEVLDAEITPNNGFYLLGRSHVCSDETAIMGPQNIGAGDWVMELDAQGNLVQSPLILSQNTIDNTQSVLAFDIANDGNLLLTGTQTNSTGTDAYIEKIGYQNNTIQSFWLYTFPMDAPDAHATGIITLDNGQIACHGYADFNSSSNIWVSLLEGIGTNFNCDDVSSIECGTTLLNEHLEGNHFSSSFYADCYTGTADYSGNDKAYQLEITQEEQYKIVLEASNVSGLDLFLLDNCSGEIIHCPQSTTTNEGNSSRQILDIVLPVGTYYLIVDSPDSQQGGSFNLSVSCDCTCIEPIDDQPIGRQYLCDNFENMEDGLVTEQSTRWRLWKNDDNNFPSSEIASNGDNNYLHVQQGADSEPNVIYDLNNRTEGRYRLSWRMWVEEDFEGSYNILHALPDEVGQDALWAYHVFFRNNGLGELYIGDSQGEPSDTFFFQHHRWLNVVNIIDIDRDSAELWINHQFIAEWKFDRTQNSGLPSKNLAGINFFASDHTNYKIDDICMWQASEACVDEMTENPVCVDNGAQYPQAHAARCKWLYISKEWRRCFSICDKGGQFIYRGDSFSGELSSGDFVPDLLLTEDSILAAYGNNFPFFPAADIYVFYNDEFNQEVNAFLNSESSSVRGFLFSCGNPEEEFLGGQEFIRQIHPSENNPDFQNELEIGLYYLVVMGSIGATYNNLSITPGGPCGFTFNDIILNNDGVTTISGSLEGSSELNFDTGEDTGEYSGCYSGDRTYEGNDIVYKFQLEEPSILDIELDSREIDTAGLFLYNFLCGRNCINYAEAPDEGGIASLDSVLLDAGVYYLVVDRNIFSNDDDNNHNDSFDLKISYQEDEDYNLFTFSSIEDTFGPACDTDFDSFHVVSINKNAALNEKTNTTFLTENTEMFFIIPLPNGTERQSYYHKKWVEPVTAEECLINKYNGSTPFERCSYIDGDPIRINIASCTDNSVGICELSFATTTPNPGLFYSGERNVIYKMKLSDLATISVKDREVIFPTKGPLNLNGKNKKDLRIETGLRWEISLDSMVNWLEISDLSAPYGKTIQLTVEDNSTQSLRETLLQITFFKNDSPKYYRYVRVIQQDIHYHDINIGLCTSPPIPESQGDKEMCIGDDSIPLLQVSTADNASAEWYASPTDENLLHTGESFSPSPDMISNAGNYTFYVQARNEDCISPSSRQEVTLTVHESPLVDAGLDMFLCPHATGELQANISGGMPPYTLVWNNNLGTEETANVVSMNQTYTISATDANACKNEDSVAVIVADVPEITLHPQNTTCDASDGQIMVEIEGGTAPFDYIWSNGMIAQNLDNLSSGTYQVTVTDANNCSNRTDAIIENTESPSFVLNDISCSSNLETYSLSFQTSADIIDTEGLGNIEEGENGHFIISDIPNSQNINLTLNNEGLDCPNIQAINAPNCICNASAPQFLNDKDICEGEAIPLLSVGITDNQSVNWYDEMDNLLAEATNGTFRPNRSGIFRARTIDAASACISLDFTEVRLSIHQSPDISITGENRVCAGDEITLTAHIMGDYNDVVWNTGEQGLQIFDTIQNPSTYIATASLGDCQSSDTFDISLFERSNWEIVFLAELDCFYDETATISIQDENGNVPPVILWDSIPINLPISLDIGPGHYSANIQDNNGCELTLEATVTRPSEILVSQINSTPETNNDQNGTVSFDINGGTPPYTINLREGGPIGDITATKQNVPEGTAVLIGLNAGHYFIEVVDDKGCIIRNNSFSINLFVPTNDIYQNLNWTIHPNPTTGQLYIELNQSISEQAELTITNILGKSILFPLSIPVSATSFELNLSDLPKGVYMIHLRLDDKFLTQKIVIQ